MDMFYQDDAPYIEDEGKRTKTYFINISIPLERRNSDAPLPVISR